MRLTTIALLLCSVSVARAADNESEAIDAINRGRLLFEQGAFAAAREQFVEAKRLAPNHSNPYRRLLITDEKLGRCADVLWDFDQFRQLVKPDDSRLAEAAAVRDRCKESFKPKLGTLVVDSTPTGAEVHLEDPNSPAAGVTPYRNDQISAGAHVVHLARAGYAPASQGDMSGLPTPASGAVAYAKAKAACETACSAPTAHMCTGEELVRTMQLGRPLAVYGWYATGMGSLFGAQTAGAAANSLVSDCGGFTSGSTADFGPQWQANNVPIVGHCDGNIPVLCCN